MGVLIGCINRVCWWGVLMGVLMGVLLGCVARVC